MTVQEAEPSVRKVSVISDALPEGLIKGRDDEHTAHGRSAPDDVDSCFRLPSVQAARRAWQKHDPGVCALDSLECTTIAVGEGALDSP
jgi:hypothetical protein